MTQIQTRPPRPTAGEVAEPSSIGIRRHAPPAGPMFAGVVAGGIAAVAVDLLSLNLRSPDPAFLNTATLGAAVLILGLVSGAAWKILIGSPRRIPLFVGGYVVGAVLTIALAMLAEGVLSGVVAFVLPVTAVAFLVTGTCTVVLTPVLRPHLGRRWWVGLAAVALAVATSASLAERARTERTPLALPPSTVAQVAVVQPTAELARPVEAPVTVATPLAIATPVAVATVAPRPPSREPGRYAGITFVVGQGSKATFKVGEQIARMPLPNEAVVATAALSGEVHLDGRASTVRLELWRLSSDQPTRDRYIKSTMFPNDQFATFLVPEQEAVPEGTRLGDAVGKGPVGGTLGLKGKNFPIDFELVEGRDDGDIIYLLGRTTFTWQQLGLEPPSSTGIVQINDDVAVEILLAARPKPSGS